MQERRVRLAHLPTPLEPMDRLAAHLGWSPGSLWVKRDDATGLAGGGNKARKLEYLCAEALDRGCDTLVTGGGTQSNHVRMTAAAANRLGLGCTVVLAGDPDEAPAGNVVLDVLLGAEIVWVADSGAPLRYYAVEAAIQETASRLAQEGRRPYPIPIGGASTLGALAYAHAAEELQAQELQAQDVQEEDGAGRGRGPAEARRLGRRGAQPGMVIVADGSGGTHAGLIAGLGDHGRVLGVDVGARPDLDEQVPAMAVEVAALAGLPAPSGQAWIDHAQVGDGYGAPTETCREALHLAARLEGLVLDPVYTGKAMAGLLAGCREGRIREDRPVVFLHTGGLPALFVPRYARWL